MAGAASPSPASPSVPTPSPRPVIVRRLERNLAPPAVLQRLKEAERLRGAGEREIGFYLLEVQRRKIWDDAGCTSFEAFVVERTDTGDPRKAKDLVRVSKALESLPSIDDAYNRGEIYWSAVRAVVAVADPSTDERWAGYCRTHSVREIEARVASCRRGDDPWKRSSDRRPHRHPYKFLAKPVLHQLLCSLVAVVSREKGRDVTLEEALEDALPIAISWKTGEDRKRAQVDRKLPPLYRQVIYNWEGEYAVATPDGPERIPAETAKRLLAGARTVDLSDEGPAAVVADPAAPAGSSQAADPAANSAGASPAKEGPEPLTSGKKIHTWGNVKTQVPAAPASPPEASPLPIVEHASNLSTPDRPAVPKEKRDRPNDGRLVLRVLSRDGYFCRIRGCLRLAERSHHIEHRMHGGRTLVRQEIGLCLEHHDLIHSGKVLVSGTPDDLRISDANFHPLSPPPGAGGTILCLEGDPEGPPPPEGPPGDPPGVEGGAGAPRLPEVLDAAAWRQRRASFEWSGARRMLLWHPERFRGPAEDSGPAPAGAPPAGGMALGDFLGQPRVIANILEALEVAKLDGELPAPILLAGPPGLGKTTIAKGIARELGTGFHQAQGPSLKDAGGLIGLLPEIRKGEVLFIDELHALPRDVAECLYQALDEGALSVPVAAGAGTSIVKIRLEPFVLIGATTEEARIPRPLLSRFALRERLDLYAEEDLAKMALAAGRSRGVEVTEAGARALARGSRGTPRLLLAHLRRARGLARLAGTAVTGEIALRALERQGIDAAGLGATDRRILAVLLARKRPIGLRSLADLLGESAENIADVYEPFLLREGYILRTFRGRAATDKAREALEWKPALRRRPPPVPPAAPPGSGMPA